jgi:DinB superfamily
MNPYESFLAGRNPLEVIEQTARQLSDIAVRVSRPNMEWRPAAGKWNAREILCHLADSEIVFAFRLRQALAEDHHVIQPFDQDRWAQVYASGSARTALGVFSSVREWNLELISSLSPEAMSKRLTHPERGEMTVRVVVETMAGHDLNHLTQLEAIAGRFAQA